jgi:hypothetical protein
LFFTDAKTLVSLYTETLAAQFITPQEEHMNFYEDKYLREKINRIIARQKEGKIVIAAY